MALKLVVFSCLLAAAYGSAAPAVVAAYAQPVAARLEEFDPFPQYTYGYSVADSITGDFKTQNERRNGDLVQGSYSLIESDGTRRVVEYEADSVNGFNANVRYETVGAPAVVAEPAVVPARIAAAPVAAVAEPVVAAKVAAPVAAVAPARYAVAPAPVFGRYAAPAAVAAPAPYFARYATSPVAAAPVVARYTSAPFVDARYAATPVVAARYAAAPAPLTYAAPFATASYATYAGPVSGAYTTYTSSGPVAYTAVAPAVAPAAVAPVRAAPAKLVEPVAAAGYRYP